MNAIELLKTQHSEVDALFAKIEHESTEADWHDMVGRLVDRLTLHAALEQEIFYPAVAMLSGGGRMTAHARDEHAKVVRMLEPLRVPRAERRACAQGLRELRRTVEHHVAEEEQEIMACADWLGAATLRDLGDRMEARMHAGETGARLAAGGRR